ncbi:hypothetical protein OFB80_34425, partial [Escherichia coli]|nr:hypothetical protein [Escherichia coli]
PPAEGSLQEPPKEGGDLAEPPAAAPAEKEAAEPAAEPSSAAASAASAEATPAPKGFWVAVGVIGALLAIFYAVLSFERL